MTVNLPSPDLLNRELIRGDGDQPLFRQVHNALAVAIADHFAHGETFWSERLLMQTLGLARGTVRQALAELEKDGMIVRDAARRTWVHKTGLTSIGIIYQHTTSDRVNELIQRFASHCLRQKLHLELYHVPGGLGTAGVVERLKRSPQQERLILFWHGDEKSNRFQAELSGRGYRSVSFDDEGEHSPLGCSVETDDALIVRQGLDHLWELGHRHVAFLVNEPIALISVRRKVEEFEMYFAARGEGRGDVVVPQAGDGDGSFALGYTLTPRIWALPERPTAIFTASDPGAWAALRWLAEQDVRVPREVSVLGSEGVRLSEFTHPPLTTVGHAYEALAARALELLTQDQVRHELVAPKLVFRESTGPRPVLS